jgi:hypothetical protein
MKKIQEFSVIKFTNSGASKYQSFISNRANFLLFVCRTEFNFCPGNFSQGPSVPDVGKSANFRSLAWKPRKSWWLGLTWFCAWLGHTCRGLFSTVNNKLFYFEP